jgi:pseudaminic acid synthase
MKIGNFDLDKDGVYIIAELSANHAGSLQVAFDSIKAAKDAGANAVKLQTYTADSLTINVKRKEFEASGLWEGKYLYDLYKEAATPYSWHKELFDYANEIGIDIFSTPFDKDAVDFLETFNPIAYKIASFELTDYDLVKYTASKGKPIIISTGIAKKDEIKDVVNICKSVGNNEIILLKCTSSYPAQLEDANLMTIPDLKKEFDVEVGFSDHTLGITAPIVATTLKAKVIEKHFMLDKSLNSADAGFSLDIKEFEEMVDAVRDSEKLLGNINYELNDKINASRHYSRGLYINKDIKKGEVLSHLHIRSARPALGIHPKYLEELIGKKVLNDLSYGDEIKEEFIEDFKV